MERIRFSVAAGLLSIGLAVATGGTAHAGIYAPYGWMLRQFGPVTAAGAQCQVAADAEVRARDAIDDGFIGLDAVAAMLNDGIRMNVVTAPNGLQLGFLADANAPAGFESTALVLSRPSDRQDAIHINDFRQLVARQPILFRVCWTGS